MHSEPAATITTRCASVMTDTSDYRLSRVMGGEHTVTLQCQVQELYCIRVNEQEIDRIFAETLQKQEPNPSRLRSLV